MIYVVCLLSFFLVYDVTLISKNFLSLLSYYLVTSYERVTSFSFFLFYVFSLVLYCLFSFSRGIALCSVLFK